MDLREELALRRELQQRRALAQRTGGQSLPLQQDPRMQAAVQQKIARQEADARQAAAMAQAYGESSPFQQFGIGVANSGLNTWEGTKQIARGIPGLEQSPLVQPNQQSIASVRNTPLDWYSGAGRVAGDIAQVMVPGSLVKAAVPALARFPAAVDTVMAGAQAGAGYTEGDESRAANALRATAMAGGAHAAARVAGGMVRPTEEGAAMLARGIPLTPGQAGGEGLRKLEQSAESIPLIGSSIQKMQNRAMEAWNKETLARVAPTGKVADIGQKGLQEVDDQFRTAYAEVLQHLPPKLDFGVDTMTRLSGVVTRYRPLLGADARDTLNGEVAALVREGIEGIPRDALKLRRAQIQKLAQSSYNRGDARLGDAYAEIKDLFSQEFMARLPTQQAAQLATLDKKYSQFVPILRAASTKGAVANEGTLTPGALLGALKADDPSLRDKAFALGNRPGQQEAQQAQQVFRRMIPSVGPGTAEKVGLAAAFGGGLVADPMTTAAAAAGLYGAAKALPATRAGVLGQLPGQGALRRVTEALPPAVRSQVVEGLLEVQDPRERSRTVMGGDLASRLPASSLAVLAERPWFKSWSTGPVRDSANTGRGHALRLSLLSASDKGLTKEQKAALREVQQAIDPSNSYKTRN